MQGSNTQITSHELEWHSIIGNKTSGQKIASGAYGHVYKVIHEGIPLAIKQVDMDSRLGVTSLSEMDISRKIYHPNIANIFGMRTAKGPNSKTVGLIMPLATSNLHDYIRTHRPATEVRLSLFHDIVCGVDFLHRSGILHMDLKPANILIFGQGKTARAVVADFGLSIYVDNSKKKSLDRDLVTITYRAPEAFPNKDGSKLREYTSKVDVWSLGILLMRILNPDTDLFPDHTRTLRTINEIFNDNQRSATISRFLPSYIPRDIVSVLNKMLNMDPKQRPDCEDILRCPSLSSKPIPEGYICCPNIDMRESSRIDYLVIDRISRISYICNYQTDTVFLAIDLYHRSVGVAKPDYKSRLLLGMTCVFMASKMLENQPHTLVSITLPEWSEKVYNTINVKNMEISIIKHLKGVLYRPNLFTLTKNYDTLRQLFETLRSAHIYTGIDMSSYLLEQENNPEEDTELGIESVKLDDTPIMSEDDSAVSRGDNGNLLNETPIIDGTMISEVLVDTSKSSTNMSENPTIAPEGIGQQPSTSKDTSTKLMNGKTMVTENDAFNDKNTHNKSISKGSYIPFKEFYPTTGYWKYMGYNPNSVGTTNRGKVESLSNILYEYEC